jgi:hypothetical protein
MKNKVAKGNKMSFFHYRIERRKEKKKNARRMQVERKIKSSSIWQNICLQ